MSRLRVAIISGSLLLAAVVVAGPRDDYRCQVERVDAPDTTGATIEDARKLYVGREFTVDRRSGIMAGVLKNSYATRPVVIDEGSSENAFKVVTTMRRDQGAGAGSSVHVLTINEFEDGEKKSFVFFENGIVYFGSCAHF